MIDVEDLAAFALSCAHDETSGVFNVTGPTTTLESLLATCSEITRAERFPDMSMPRH